MENLTPFFNIFLGVWMAATIAIQTANLKPTGNYLNVIEIFGTACIVSLSLNFIHSLGFSLVLVVSLWIVSISYIAFYLIVRILD